VTDALEEQGIADFISQNVNNKQTDEDLLEQLRIYEVVLQHEDESRSNRESTGANGLVFTYIVSIKSVKAGLMEKLFVLTGLICFFLF